MGVAKRALNFAVKRIKNLNISLINLSELETGCDRDICNISCAS